MLDSPAGQQLAVSTIVVDFDDAIHSPPASGNAETAFLTVHTAAIRYRVDGTAPTALIGHLASPGDAIELVDGTEINLFKAIRSTGTDGEIFATFR